MAAGPQLFNALNGAEVMEIILRKIRSEFEQDTKFRQSQTFPNLKFEFTLTMKFEPGMVDKTVVAGNADTRAKIQAQADRIAAMEKENIAREQRFEEIETQAGILISDLESKTRDLDDANRFIKVLMADKLALQEQLKGGKQTEFFPDDVPAVDLAAGEAIVVSGESEVIDEPDRLRDEGVTEKPAEEIVFTGGGEAVGEPTADGVTIGKPPAALVLADDSGKVYSTRDIQPARGVTITSNAKGMGAAAPGAVKGRPRG